jgi:hypothetical protein
VWRCAAWTFTVWTSGIADIVVVTVVFLDILPVVVVVNILPVVVVVVVDIVVLIVVRFWPFFFFVFFVAKTRKINQLHPCLFIRKIQYDDSNTFVFFAALDGDALRTRFIGGFIEGFFGGFFGLFVVVCFGKGGRDLVAIRGVPLATALDLVFMLLLLCRTPRKGGPHYIVFGSVV